MTTQTIERRSENVSSHSSSINPRWVVHVLKHRGLPSPDVTKIQAALHEMSSAAKEILRHRVMRLHSATETSDDAEGLRTWCKEVLSKSEAVLPPATVEAVEVHQSPDRECHREVDAHRPAEQTPVALRKYERSFHVYATKGAASFEPVEIDVGLEKADQRIEIAHTIQIEMAKAETQRRYEWDSKIIFRLSIRELPIFAAVLLGYSPFFLAGNHGPSKDKFLELRDQIEGSIFIKIKQGKRIIALPIGPEDTFSLSSLVLKQLQKNSPHLDNQTILELVKRSGTMYAKSVGGGH